MQAAGSLSVPASAEQVAVHSIPCKTTFSGPAKVSSYFKLEDEAGIAVVESPQKDASPNKIATFRGRTLRGAEIVLPAEFTGYAVKPVRKGPMDPKKGEELEAVRQFSRMTYWNHDTRPSALDEMPQLMEWAALSGVMHGARPDV